MSMTKAELARFGDLMDDVQRLQRRVRELEAGEAKAREIIHRLHTWVKDYGGAWTVADLWLAAHPAPTDK